MLSELLDRINFTNQQFELRSERFASIRTVTMHFDNVKADASDKLASVAAADVKHVS